MGIRNIQIVSADIEYVNKILGRLVSEVRNDIRLEVVTDKRYFIEFNGADHPIDVLFIDEALATGVVSLPSVRQIYVISERHDANAVSKFDGAAGILRILGDDALKSNNGINKRDCKIVNIVSPCGGCGKTTASIGIAYRLAQMNRKTLYIDAEYAQDFYEVMPKDSIDEAYSDEQMAALMINITPQSLEYINQNIVHGVFDYIPPFKNNLAGYHLDPKRILEAAKIIANKSLYDYIVIEHGTGLSGEEIDSIYEGGRLVVVSNVDLEHERVQRLLRLFRGYSGQGTVLLHNCDNKYLEDSNNRFSVAENIFYQKNDTIEEILANGYYKKTAESIL